MLQLAINVLVLSSSYALIAIGYVIVYRVSRVMNLAHGELTMLGAYLLTTIATDMQFGLYGAVLFAAFMSGVVGLLVYVFLMRWMTGQALVAAILATIALGILIRGIAVLFWTAQQHYPGKLLKFSNLPIQLNGAVISTAALILVVATAITFISLAVFLRFGRWGIRLRACGQNPLLAAQAGINLHVVFAMAWVISTFTGGLAGILISLETGAGSALAIIGLKAFPAALVGGLDSLAGAILGALIVATAEVVAIQYINPLLSDVIPFVILITMLMVRPWGLLGTREKLDRV